MSERPPGSYGIDAPRLIVVPALLVVAGLVQAVLTRTFWPFVGVVLIAACCGLGFYASRWGKFVVWGRLLEDLRGDEEVLDLGCGRGALLVSAALRVPKGRAVGVDVWRADQSGNGPEATLRNAAAAGVADRVEVETANVVSLPFPDESFDLVVSNIVLHNLKAFDDRNRAVAEAVRVLRPGGRLLIADLNHTTQYERQLRTLPVADIERRGLGWRQWWSGPWLPTHLVSAVRRSAGQCRTLIRTTRSRSCGRVRGHDDAGQLGGQPGLTAPAGEQHPSRPSREPPARTPRHRRDGC